MLDAEKQTVFQAQKNPTPKEKAEFKVGAASPQRVIRKSAMFALASVRGHRMLAVVPNRVPLEKKLLLRVAGAELEVVSDELCPSPGMGEGSINLAKTYAKAQADRWAMPNQYENEANVEAHVATTGPEIWRQTGGEVTHGKYCRHHLNQRRTPAD